jgi:hypothetical protein
MASPESGCPEIRQSVEIYAETAVDIDLTLRSKALVFRTRLVDATFTKHGLTPASLGTTDISTRIYVVTVYEPPEGVTYMLQEVLHEIGVEVVHIKTHYRTACGGRACPRCNPAVGGKEKTAACRIDRNAV